MHCGGHGAISNTAAGSCAEMCACRSDLVPHSSRPRFDTGNHAMRHFSPTLFDTAAREPAILPNRPYARVLNRVIPLFFIGRNKNGFWRAREAGGRIGGMFLLLLGRILPLRRSRLQDDLAPARRQCANPAGTG